MDGNCCKYFTVNDAYSPFNLTIYYNLVHEILILIILKQPIKIMISYNLICITKLLLKFSQKIHVRSTGQCLERHFGEQN